MVEKYDQYKEKIDNFLEQKESETPLGQIEDNLEELGLDVQVSHWLKNDEKMLQYAQLYLKESKSIKDTFKLQFLELKISITCPYFEDFKDFLEELKKGEKTPTNTQESGGEYTEDDTNSHIEDIGQGHNFLGTEISAIKSSPFYKNPSTGVTRCSATARFNGLNFGLDLPSSNAYDAGGVLPSVSQYQHTIPENKIDKRPTSNWDKINKSEFDNLDDHINFADIYVSSNSKYGHRAVAFKDSSGERYVLDPYTRVNGVLNDKPKKLSDYMSQRKVLKAHFYTSPGYNFESRRYA